MASCPSGRVRTPTPQLYLIHDPKDSDRQARWYYQLKAEYARSIAQDRSLVNPVKEQVLCWRS